MLRIRRQPQSLTVESGETASFAVDVEGQPSGPIGFTWRRNGSTVVGSSNSPFLELPQVTAASAGYYSVTVTDGATSLESDVALLRVTRAPQPPAKEKEWGRIALLLLAGLSLLAAAWMWSEPATDCSVTVEQSARSSGATFTGRTVTRSGAGGATRERTRERTRQTTRTPPAGGSASTERCTVPTSAAGNVTVVESRERTDAKEVVIALLGLTAALGLAAAFYTRVAKVSFPGGSLELRDVTQKTAQAVGTAETSVQALKDALAGVTSSIEKETEIRTLTTEKLALRIEQLERERPRTVAE